jgi:protein MAK11
MTLLHTISHSSRIHDILFCHIDLDTKGKRGEMLFVGAEDHKVSVYHIGSDTEVPKVVAEMVGHTNRFVVTI